MRRSTFCAAAGAAAAGLAWPVAAGAAPRAPGALEPRAAVPVVRVQSGARELLLAVDTGDAASTLSPAAAVALGLTVTPLAGTGAGRATLHGLVLGDAALRDHSTVVTGVGELRGLAGAPIDGALGYEAFKDRALTIDFANREMRFPTELPDGEQTTITWLKYQDTSPPLVTFDGLDVDGFTVTAQLDTLMSKNAILFTSKLPDLAVDPDLRAKPYTYEEEQLQPGRVGALRLGSTLLAAQPLVYAADAKAHVPTTAIAVVLGDALFARRAVTLDFPGSILVVT